MLKFTKMHGIGNDYIYFNCFEQTIQNPEELSQRISDRHFGVGGDGIVLICPSHVADAKMRMFNADGSEGKMCGNAIRCVGKYLYDNHMVSNAHITIETLSGIKTLELFVKDGKVWGAKVDMGKAIWAPAEIPVVLPGEKIVNAQATIGDTQYAITCVSMGNPHCVVFVEDPQELELEKIGPLFENAPLFPQRVNTEFVRVIDESTLEMRVWERGSGETWACGTGACATVAAAVACGHCKENTDVTVKLKGGDLTICYTEQGVWMTGPAQKVFDGVLCEEIMENGC